MMSVLVFYRTYTFIFMMQNEKIEKNKSFVLLLRNTKIEYINDFNKTVVSSLNTSLKLFLFQLNKYQS